jgi:hypothetical protein
VLRRIETIVLQAGGTTRKQQYYSPIPKNKKFVRLSGGQNKAAEWMDFLFQ